MDLLYRVMVGDSVKEDCLGDDHFNLKANDWCIVEYDRYEDIVRVISFANVPEGMDTSDFPRIKRQATLIDQGKAHENRIRSKSLQRTAEALVQKHKLPMRLRVTHMSFDGKHALFIYTSPGRVDFRDLLKDMNKQMNLRVELRQIGPRDQAAMIGGLGSCGRELCCSSFLTNFVSINIKMAKTQGISMNPSSIIGACGRLKCCLDYEYEGYKALIRNLPRPGSWCECEGCEGKVLDVNTLEQTVRVSLDNGDRVVTVPVDQIKQSRR